VDGTTDTHLVSGVARISQPSAADIAAVQALAPLSADLMIGCGPFEVPVAVVASKPALEQQDSEEAQIARDFLAEDPWHGMGTVHAGGWMLLARDDDTVVIGQRTGDVGLGAVVTLVRDGDRFEARNMGGWQLRPRNPSEHVEMTVSCTAHGNTVVTQWSCGQDLDGVPDRVYARVELLERPDAVHFLLLSAPNPAVPPPTGWTVGTGRTETAAFALSTPLGARRLFDNARIPPPPMTIDIDGEIPSR